MRNKLDWWVGLFTALGIVAIFFVALKASDFQINSSSDSYEVYAFFDEIGGLKKRSPVTMAGVLVGRVTDIRLDAEHFQARVTFTMNKKFNKIPEDSSASILTAGILGEKYVGLTPGGSEEFLENKAIISHTQSAFVLENLISKFLVSLGD